MRKLTVLLLAGALLAVTGGASVARAKEFAALQCFVTAPGGVLLLVKTPDTSFAAPPECAVLPVVSSCAVCAAAITRHGLKLVETNLPGSGPDLNHIWMIFTEDDGDDDDDDD